MLRISKLTDYGTVVLAHLAADHASVVSAADVASDLECAESSETTDDVVANLENMMENALKIAAECKAALAAIKAGS